jgi:hypothetical protein
MAPNVTVTYSCSLSGVGATLTNTITATATTAPGPSISQTASASVTVQAGASPPPLAPGAATSPPRSTSVGSRGYATLTVSRVRASGLGNKHPGITLDITLSRTSFVHLTLVGAKGRQLQSWRVHEAGGRQTLELALAAKARHPGNDELLIATSGNPKTKRITIRLKT